MSTERRYDPKTVEPKWQAIWEDERTWEVSNDDAGGARDVSTSPRCCPYPSGEPHMGHLKNYAVGDAVAHFQRRMGRRVLHPIGYDAFGLPAENHAIRSGEHPRDSSASSIAAFQREFRSWGVSFDWSREIATHEPTYYRWTQWIFLKLYERGLAYRSRAAVNWCPKDQTVLANEQVIDGRCERCGTLGRGTPARAVVLPHHRLRRPPARRPRRPSSGPRTWCGCSATGSGAPRAPRSRSPRPRWASTTRSSPPARTRCSARRSSSWRPSTPTCCAWPRAPSTRRPSASTSTTR